jgi:hypothetical protein
VQWPYHVRSERNGSKTFEMFADSVSVNQGLTDDLFTIGVKTKILPERK